VNADGDLARRAKFAVVYRHLSKGGCRAATPTRHGTVELCVRVGDEPLAIFGKTAKDVNVVDDKSTVPLGGDVEAYDCRGCGGALKWGKGAACAAMIRRVVIALSAGSEAKDLNGVNVVGCMQRNAAEDLIDGADIAEFASTDATDNGKISDTLGMSHRTEDAEQ